MLISPKGADLGHMLPVNINKKAYLRSTMTISHLNLSDFERSISRSLRFQRLVSRKGAGVVRSWVEVCYY